MKRDGTILTWAYAVELILVGLLYTLMLHFVGAEKLVNVIEKHWQVFIGIGVAFLAVGIALSIWFWQGLEGEFGKYLKWRKADGHYLRAYQFQVVLFLFATVFPALMAFGRNDLIAHTTWCALVYASVNGLTIVNNTVKIVGLL